MDEVIQLDDNTYCEETPTATDTIERKIFKKKLYLPKRSYKKFVKYFYAALGTIIIILLIIIFINFVKFKSKNSELKINSKNRSSEELQNFSYELIIGDNNNLWGYDSKSEKIRLLGKANNFINTYDVHRNNVIFWSEKNGLEIFSTSSEKLNISQKNVNVIFNETRFNPQALAVDFINNKLYAVDESTGTLIVIDVETKQYSILLTNLINPRDIILDPAEKYIFILEHHKGISRINMDGTNYHHFFMPFNITGITVDRKNQRIYWVEANPTTVRSSNYDGSDSIDILEESTYIYSLVYFDDQLFWLWYDNNQNDSSLRSCTIKKNTCEAHYVHPLTFSNATIIKAFSHSKEIMKDTSSACMRRNGGCQQMCLLTSHKKGGRTCACYSGWELKSDLMSCQPIDEFILHAKKNVIRGFSIYGPQTRLTNGIFPIVLNTKSLVYKDSFEMTYNANSDYFHASDDTCIYKVNLKGPNNQIVICNITGQYYINNIAFDRFTKTLFYIKHSVSSSNEHSIMVYDTNRHNASHQMLLSFPYNSNFYFDACPHNLIVHPKGEYLFYSVISDDNDLDIYQVNIDNNTNMRLHFTEYYHRQRNYLDNLQIDGKTNSLWWLHNGFKRSYRVQYTLQINNTISHEFNYMNREVKILYVYREWLIFSCDSIMYSVFKQPMEEGNQLTSPSVLIEIPSP